MNQSIRKFLTYSLLILLVAAPLANAAETDNSQSPIAQEITALLQNREALVAQTSALGRDRVLSALHEKDRELAFKEQGRGRFVKFVNGTYIKHMAREDRISLHSLIHLHKGNAPALYGLVEEVAGEYDLPTPLVILCDDETFMISADSLSHTTGTLVIGKTIALDLSRDDLRTTLLHECAHINNRDLLARHACANGLPVIPALAVGGFVGFGTTKVGGRVAGVLAGLISGILTHLTLRRQIFPRLIRWQEQRADRAAVNKVGDGDAMGRALNASVQALAPHYDSFDEAKESLVAAIETEIGSHEEATKIVANYTDEELDLVDHFDDLFGEVRTHPTMSERMHYEISETP